MAQSTLVSPPHDNRGYLAAITSSAKVLYAVGGQSEGLLLASSNGSQFHPRAKFSRGLRSVHVHDERVFVCGQNGFLAYSDDEGASFTAIAHEGGGCIYDFAEVDGVLLASADGGVVHRIALDTLEVSRLDTGASDRMLRVEATQHGLFLLDAAGEIRRAPSLSGAFEVVHRGTAPLTKLTETAAGTLLVSGDRGQLLRSIDAGRTFTPVDHEIHVDVEGVGAFADRVVVWGGRGTLLLSTDDGLSFEPIDVPAAASRATLWSAHAVEGAVLIAGDDGLVLALDPLPQAWRDREDRFEPDYALQPLFAEGPTGFIGERLRTYVKYVNGIEDEPEPERAGDPVDADDEEPDDDDDDANNPELQGEDAWKVDAIARVQGLWGGGIDEFEAVWGVEAPVSLQKLARAVRGANPWTTFNEFRLDSALFAEPSDPAKNLFEQLILSDQLNYLGTALPDAFSGLVNIGSLGNGDTYHLGVPGLTEGDEAQVVFYDHEQHCYTTEFADSLDSLAYLAALSRAQSQDELSPEAASEGYEKLRGRVDPSWHFSIDEHDEDFEPYETEDHMHRFCFWRARWLITMFRHDHGGDPADVAESFMANLNVAIDDESAKKRADVAKNLVPTAIYAVWRAYIFEEPQLELYLDVCRNHRARLARDAGRLIEELRAGRKSIGRISDWPAKLAAVRALDLDPRRAEAREEEARVRKAELNARRGRLTAAMADLEGDALEVFCREHVRDVQVRPALLAALLARQDHAQAREAAVFLHEQGYSRNGSLYRDEQHDASRELADHASAALQLLLVGQFVTPYTADEDDDVSTLGSASFAEIEVMIARWQRAGTFRPECLALVREGLADDETDKRWRTSGLAAVLGRSEDPAGGDVLAAKIRATPAEGGFETRMHHDDVGRDLCAALGRTGAKAHAESLVPLAKSETMMHAPAAAALALARLDPARADAVLLTRLLERTTSFNNAEDNARAVLAYGMMGAQQPAARHPALLDALVANAPMASKSTAVKLATACATQALSGSQEHSAVVDALRETLAYAGYDPIKTQRFGLEALHDRPALAEPVADALARLLDHEDAGFVDEVLLAMRRAGLDADAPEPPLTWFAAARLSVEEACSLLAKTERRGAQHLARRLAGETSDAVRTAFETAMRRVIDRAPQTVAADLSRSDSRLLKEITLAFAAQSHVPVDLYDRALRHPNRKVKDPVLRNPPPEPKLADAMRVVVAEKYGWQETTARTWLEQHA
ncbi:MAG: hypothetical protein AAGA54_17965 [Myxococcota bacterium]